MSLTVNEETVNDRAKLLMHRIAARQIALNPQLVDEARSRLTISPHSADHVAEWREVLSMDGAEIRRALSRRTEKMDRLRLSSPFGLILDFKDTALRKRIWRLARKGVPKPNIQSSVPDIAAW